MEDKLPEGPSLSAISHLSITIAVTGRASQEALSAHSGQLLYSADEML